MMRITLAVFLAALAGCTGGKDDGGGGGSPAPAAIVNTSVATITTTASDTPSGGNTTNGDGGVANTDTDGGDAAGADAGAGGCAATAALPPAEGEPVAIAGGSLRVTLAPATLDPCSIGITLVGAPPLVDLHFIDAHTVQVTGVAAGAHDVIITGTVAIAVGGLTLAGEQQLGVRINAVSVADAVPTELANVELVPLGSIAGRVTLAHDTDATGIDVYIPGTSYLAKTDAAGNFVIGNVPKGEHNLEAEHLHYHRGKIGKLTVAPEATTTAPDFELALDLGEAGPIVLDPPATAQQPLGSLTVRYSIVVAGHPTLMRVSEDQLFANQEAQPFVSSGTFTFALDDALKAGGKATRKLYIQLTENGATSLLSADVVIDLFPDFAFTVAAPRRTALDGASWSFSGLPIYAGQDAMLFSLNPDMSDPQTFSPAFGASYSLPATPASCGTHTVYSQVSLANGVKSPILSHAIEYVCAQAISTVNAPYDRDGALITAGGSKLFYFGGRYNGNSQNDGAVYDVATDTWTALPATNAPSPRSNAFGKWTGTEFIVWGGNEGSDGVVGGARYDPAMDTWTPISDTGAPGMRYAPYISWTGDKLVVFGGMDSSGYATVGDGGVYDPTTDQWTAITDTGSPFLYDGARARWSGGKLIVFGGKDDNDVLLGGKYIDALNSGAWTDLTGAPSARVNPILVNFGEQLLFFGGDTDGSYSYQGDLTSYDPATDTFTALPTPAVIDGTRGDYYSPFTQIVGSHLVIWGGSVSSSITDAWGGLAYDTAAQTWSKPEEAANAPVIPDDALYNWNAAVAGDRMALWVRSRGLFFYDPAANIWGSAPAGYHEDEPTIASRRVRSDDANLFVWGGDDANDSRNDGTVYFFNAFR